MQQSADAGRAKRERAGPVNVYMSEVKRWGIDALHRAIKGVKNARIMLASGITTLRSASETHGLGHYVRRAIDAGWIPGPRLVLSGEAICSTGGHGWFIGREADGHRVQALVPVRDDAEHGVPRDARAAGGLASASAGAGGSLS
jgi:imidazolonepropionase-like amidohydrolase